jgi:hypothetical protein
MKLNLKQIWKYALRGIALEIFSLIWVAVSALLGIAVTLTGTEITAIGVVWLAATFVVYGYIITKIMTWVK